MFTFQNITVLYVESDPDLQHQVEQAMRKHDLTVFATDTALSAYDLFRTHKIDIIVIDCKSSNENGLEFIRHLRQKEILTPIIVTTTDTSKEILLQAINLDISRCIIKPYAIHVLLEALESAAKKVLSCHPLSTNDLDHEFSYDPINKSIIHPDGSAVQLSKKEYLLIELLLHNKRQIIPYSLIERSVWQEGSMSMDALRTLVRSIRKKTYADIISNHNGIGYKIDF
ncbi:MAG TPA: response regulator transcription factor [Sulfuricurvum sp.]|nr:response regulator transcription factor [Sulfuricurvum sp.]